MSEANISSITRRRLMGAGAVAAAASVVSPVLAQTEQGAGSSEQGGQNAQLVKNYPKPPFPKQQQPWPGLASQMDPVPDHGEDSYRGSGRLMGRKALITGGDSGIGRAAAIAFAREGADVVINYLPDEQPDADEVIALIEEAGRKGVAIPGDIKDENFCTSLVEQAVAELQGLDIVVNNAARQISTMAFAELSSAQFDETLKTDVYAMFWITKAALEHLPDGAAIINTTSVQAYDPDPNLIDYALTKAAIVNFTKSLAKQLGGRSIRVNGVAPGPFWTPLQVTGGQSPEALPTFGGDTPLGRPGQPAELGPIYVGLAAAEASYITGQIFGASGGSGNP
ncbi:MAG TPA: SDR family oxidoreductase [Ramlibacter sp.]|jgi:NAD(P)-dependent dehydrogenase (short-subunit alcohol dehydrogenase family)